MLMQIKAIIDNIQFTLSAGVNLTFKLYSVIIHLM